jgi:two-component system chemotaxis sensor kinase CheA
MLAEKGHANFTPKQLEYIQTIYSSGNDLLHLINDILDLAKVEAGKIEVIPTEVRLQDVKQLAERQFLPLARRKGIRFSVQLDDDVPEVFYTDEHRLNQILKNLLSNAFKFTEKGSVSLIIHKAVKKGLKDRFSIGQTDSALAFSVIDTGIGIPKEKQMLIFDAFKQADGTTSRKYGGTGLGLSISREIAQLLGGFIEMDSEEGTGSSFILYLSNYELNRHAESQSARMEVAAAQVKQEISSVESKTNAYPYETNESNTSGNSLMKGKKILIVDDDMRNIFALTAALEGYEMEVLFAENGQEGIEVLQENRDIDLLMIDIMMPKMDGFEAMRLIRGMSEFVELPIIALTAKAMKHDREQCIAAGASDYISKPINLDQLFSLMQVWLYR